MKQISIGGITVGPGTRPFILAEMSANHNGSLDRALEIVEAAAKSGAHGLKLQTYTADTMTINARGGLFDITDAASLWKGRNLYELYQEAATPWEWHEPIMRRARELGLVCFSTPFDETAVDFLESLDVPAYKIASFENADWQLLKKVAQTGKPVVMSTGASTLSEIAEAVSQLKANGCNDIVLLKCTSTYPASPENSNLRTIPHMQEMFECVIGLSDHTTGIGVAVASVACGASMIEKHFTLSRSDGGVDSAFSLEPDEFRQLGVEVERAFLSLGGIRYVVQDAETASRQFKRSIYIVADVRAGERLSKGNLRIIRPGDGLPPKFFEIVCGGTAKRDLKAGTPLHWDDVL